MDNYLFLLSLILLPLKAKIKGEKRCIKYSCVHDSKFNYLVFKKKQLVEGRLKRVVFPLTRVDICGDISLVS